MTDSAAIKSNLRTIRRTFEQQGINSEVQIAEHIAYLLVVYKDGGPAAWTALQTNRSQLMRALDQQYDALLQKYSQAPIPQPPPAPDRLSPEMLHLILEALKRAIAAAEDKLGLLFQRFLRFELLQNAKGGQYPTPHHIAEILAQLIELGDDDSLLDPTCGTAGLLVAAHILRPEIQITGYDYDPNWAAMAWSNLYLNGRDPAHFTIASQSAFSITGQDRTFTRIVMNPPFGGGRSAAELQQAKIDRQFGSRSEIVLVAHALNLLATDGRAAVLVSRGVLFGGGGEQTLRSALLRHRLEAVVALPGDAFQPYNSASGTVLLFQKTANQVTEPIWFIRLDYDGYEPGTGRDLSKTPSDQNDLPLLRALIEAMRRPDAHATIDDAQGAQLATAQLLQPDHGTAGLLVELRQRHAGYSIQPASLSPDGLLTTIRQNDTTIGWFATLPGATTVISGTAGAAVALDPAHLTDNTEFKAGLPQTWYAAADEDQRKGKERCILIKDDDRVTGLQLILPKDKTVVDMLVTDPANIAADALLGLLVDEQGAILSPLLSSASLADLGAKLEGLNPTTMYGEQDTLAGYLIPLAAKADQELQTASLILWTDRQAAGYQTTDNDRTAYLLGQAGSGLLMLPRATTSNNMNFLGGTPRRTKADRTPQAFAITRDGRIVGVRLEQGELMDSWQPSEYLEEAAVTTSERPALILGSIRGNQAAFGERIDRLLSAIAAPRTSNDTPVPLEPWLGINALAPAQQDIWQEINQITGATGETRFTIARLTEALQQHAADRPWLPDNIAQQLQLLEAMGLVVATGDGNERTYRRTTTNDQPHNTTL